MRRFGARTQTTLEARSHTSIASSLYVPGSSREAPVPSAVHFLVQLVARSRTVSCRADIRPYTALLLMLRLEAWPYCSGYTMIAWASWCALSGDPPACYCINQRRPWLLRFGGGNGYPENWYSTVGVVVSSRCPNRRNLATCGV